MSKKPIKHITILIYAHPELYPPTLSAIEELSQIADTIDVVTRNMLASNWEYPKNVRINYINKKKYRKSFILSKNNSFFKICNDES
jgi:hypothetical protein